jgi:Dolichyl-phosphate-mannose-protein mannosyltransferase
VFGFVTLAPEVAATGGRPTVLARTLAAFPLREVVLPWIVVRLVVVPALVLSAPGDRFYAGALLSMDGQWFRLIALDGYDLPYVPANWSEYPFFPLFPAIASVPMRIGVPDTIALAGVAWLASLVAFAGLYRLAATHLDATAARWSVWVLALAPGALSLVIGYSDSLFLAGAAWALVAADSRRWVVAGVVAAVATASRPNGVLVVAALLVAVLIGRAGWRAAVAVTVPSVAFLVAWMGYLEAHAGDAFAFWSGKESWIELSAFDFLSDPFSSWLAFAHVSVFAITAVAYAWRARGQPIPWAVLTGLMILPPMLLGVVGLARYAVLAFPMQFAVAEVLSARGRGWTIAYLAVSAAALGGFAHLVVAESWVP